MLAWLVRILVCSPPLHVLIMNMSAFYLIRLSFVYYAYNHFRLVTELCQ